MAGEPEELTVVEQARQVAARSAFADVRDAMDSGDPDERMAAFGQLVQTLSGLNSEVTRDKLHVPDDAGQYRDALVSIMRRIPDGWGRWISCDAGWYPIITELDRRLAAVDPGYELHQVKEKFGCLRYYFCASDESYYDDMRILVLEAEQRCASTCETCGKPGSLHSSSRRAWVKTLCMTCAARGGFEPVGELVNDLTPDMTGVWQVSVYGGGADSVWDLTRGVVHIGGDRLEDVQVLALPRVLGTFRLRLADGSEVASELVAAIKRVR